MKTIKLGKHKVTLYDSITELPVLRFHRYNKSLLIDAGIGGDIADFDAHIEKVAHYLRGGKTDLAVKELDNLRQNVFFIHANLSPKNLAFAALVTQIDGNEYNDLSDEGLKRVCDIINDVPMADLTAQTEAVKKKIDEELTTYFPALFDDARVKEYYNQLRRRTLAVLDTILNGESAEKEQEIEDITLRMLEYNNPRNFAGQGGFEVQYDKQFENMCLTISQNLHTEPRTMSVMQYYNAFEYVQELAKQYKHRG